MIDLAVPVWLIPIASIVPLRAAISNAPSMLPVILGSKVSYNPHRALRSKIAFLCHQRETNTVPPRNRYYGPLHLTEWL